MKNKSFLVLLLLASIFFVSWAVKVRMPVNRPENAGSETYVPWYMNTYSAPVASEKWHIDAELDPNYIPVPGKDEVYMVLDSAGNVVKYRQRKQKEDGTWVWSDYTEGNAGIEEIDGENGIYLITDKDGNQRYQKYVRNKDNSYCYVDTDEKGTPLDIGSDATTITPDYTHVDGNTYAKYNDDGVMEGYRTRLDNGDGTFSWGMGEEPTLPSVSSGYTGINVPDMPAQDVPSSEFGGGMQDIQVIEGVPLDGEIQRIENADGTYTVTETIRDTRIENGERITTETVVTKVYNANDELLETASSDPYEVSREPLSASEQPDKTETASNLDDEMARVGAAVTFDTGKAQEILGFLNAERTSAKIPCLTMETASESYKIAMLKAADMAQYDYVGDTSPLYGTLSELCGKYNCHVNGTPSENILKASALSANDIHLRFQSDETSRTIRMSNKHKAVGISVAERGGMNYIAEVYLD